MSGRGTPLLKRGRFQVFRVKNRTHPYIEVRDTTDDSFIGSTGVMASAKYTVERLAQGLPMETPQESMDRTMELYAAIKPTRFRYYMRQYLGGLSWMNGGLLDDDLTDYTEEGRKARLDRMAQDHAQSREGLDPSLYPDTFREEETAIRQSYRDGTWPDADEPDDLTDINPLIDFYVAPNSLIHYQDDPSNPRTPLGVLATSPEVIPVLPEWIEDARVGMQLALRYGVDVPSVPMLPTLRQWAEILTQRYGGNWFPDLSVPERLRENQRKRMELRMHTILAATRTKGMP